MRTRDGLKIMQAYPLELKVAKTQLQLHEFVLMVGEENCYISFSGGKDSTALLDIVRKCYPNMKAVFADTGLEYPEIREFTKEFDNLTTVRPKMTFKDVITRYGYPIISKNVSHNVGIARRNPDGRVAKNIVFNDDKKGRYEISKHRPLVTAPFLISDLCCDVMKKKPISSLKMAGIVGTMACESISREDAWVKKGCNTFEGKRVQSTPLAFWTEQDILEYIHIYNLPIASVYGDILPPDTACSKWRTTGCSRTGCVFCGFGAHLEKVGEGRFLRLKETHPKLYNYCINGGAFDPTDGLWKPDNNGLGMGFVFDWCNENIKNFKIEY